MLITNYLSNEEYQNKYVMKESYFGKSKNLLAAEKACDDLAKMIKLDPWKNINRTDAHKKLVENLKKEFGFQELNIFFNTSHTANAFTVPSYGIITAINGMPIFPIKKGERYYDKKHNYYCYVEVFHGAIFKMDLTGEELMALILHEIGHNFDTTIYRSFVKLYMIALGLTINGIPVAIMVDMYKYLYGFMGTINEFIQEYLKPLANVIDVINEINATIVGFIPGIQVLGIINNLATSGGLSILGSTSAEIFSDSFATAYGYGPATASLQSKFDAVHTSRGNVVQKAVSSVPVIGTIYDLNLLLGKMAQMIADGHPDSNSRIVNQIKKLERDLDDPSIPRELKKYIKADLDAVKKTHEKFNDIENYEDRQAYLTFAFRVVNDKLGGHLDLKNTLVRALPNSEA